MASPFKNCKTVQINGTSLAYLETGSTSNPNLVLVHPHLSDLRSFTAIQELFTPYFHVISYSRRYAVPNEPIPDGVGEDWYLHAKDLVAFIQALKLQPCHLLGNSSGGTITLLVAQSNPELLLTITVEEPVCFPLVMPNIPPGIWDLLNLLWNYPWAFVPLVMGGISVGRTISLAKQDDYDGMLESFAPGACGKEAWERIKKNPERYAQAKDNNKYLGNFWKYSVTPVISVEDARKIKVPAMVLTGEHSPPIAKNMDWLLAKELGNCKEDRIVQGSQHLIHEEQPAKVMEAVVAFIRSLK